MRIFIIITISSFLMGLQAFALSKQELQPVDKNIKKINNAQSLQQFVQIQDHHQKKSDSKYLLKLLRQGFKNRPKLSRVKNTIYLDGSEGRMSIEILSIKKSQYKINGYKIHWSHRKPIKEQINYIKRILRAHPNVKKSAHSFFIPLAYAASSSALTWYHVTTVSKLNLFASDEKRFSNSISKKFDPHNKGNMRFKLACNYPKDSYRSSLDVTISWPGLNNAKEIKISLDHGKEFAKYAWPNATSDELNGLSKDGQGYSNIRFQNIKDSKGTPLLKRNLKDTLYGKVTISGRVKNQKQESICKQKTTFGVLETAGSDKQDLVLRKKPDIQIELDKKGACSELEGTPYNSLDKKMIDFLVKANKCCHEGATTGQSCLDSGDLDKYHNQSEGLHHRPVTQ